MALGGGNWTFQNKKLPGSYVNVVTRSGLPVTLSDRGVVAFAIALDWGKTNEVFTVEKTDFVKNSLRIFGHAYDADELKPMRDIFKNARTLHIYNLNSNAVPASCAFGAARYPGIVGNGLKITIQENIDDPDLFDVTVYLGEKQIDVQTVHESAELVDNDYVVYNKGAALALTAGMLFTGGSNGAAPTAATHQDFLAKVDTYSFNAIGVVTSVDNIRQLYIEYGKTRRDEFGIKFQVIVPALPGSSAPDHEGIINVSNMPETLVYWVTGAIAGCPINTSLTNKVYDGEYEADLDYTQAELGRNIDAGLFTLHRVGDTVRVLSDINSFTSYTADKGAILSQNQTIRVIDESAMSVAKTFNDYYLGKVKNNQSGRISFWNSIVKLHEELMKIEAIENFTSEDVTVEQGDNKTAIVVSISINVVNSMEQLYMTIVVL